MLTLSIHNGPVPIQRILRFIVTEVARVVSLIEPPDTVTVGDSTSLFSAPELFGSVIEPLNTYPKRESTVSSVPQSLSDGRILTTISLDA